MIILDKNSGRFIYRVAGVVIQDDKVLLHRSVHDDFWILPGGRCEFFETSKETLIREMEEEIGAHIEILRTLYFVENFFYYEDKHHHEVSIYYLIKFRPNSLSFLEKEVFYGRETEIDLDLIFIWFNIEEIETLNIYPSFLRKSLRNIKSFPEHIIHHDI